MKSLKYSHDIQVSLVECIYNLLNSPVDSNKSATVSAGRYPVFIFYFILFWQCNRVAIVDQTNIKRDGLGREWDDVSSSDAGNDTHNMNGNRASVN